MVGGWIKMRGGLLQSPKLLAMARHLHALPAFREWITPGLGAAEDLQVVADDALRCVTAALLMRVWSAAREFGHYEGDHLILPHLTVVDLDGMAGAPGVGGSMRAVGWAADLADSDPTAVGVLLPNFRQHNVSLTPAEKQAEYRRRKAEERVGNGRGNGGVTGACNTRDTNVDTTAQHNTAQDREDRQTPLPPVTGGTEVGRSVGGESFDPVREEERARKEFVARWRAAGLRTFSYLSPSLKGQLATLLADPWWAEHYPAALERAGRIPFFATGAGRHKGPLDVAEFLREPDLARQIIDGVHDPRTTEQSHGRGAARGDGPGEPVRRPGRAVAPPGKYAHLDPPAGAGPAGPAPGGPPAGGGAGDAA